MEESAKRRRVCENDGTARGASSTHASTEGQEVATSSGHDYEVFLSFRGPDTRAGFTDFLYTRMIDMGIRAYKDDEDLRKGEEFGPELLRAIEQSRISIPILSKGYASSVWCLKELVKMVECQKTKGQKIMPIFYDVAPSEVRHQTGSYGEAFRSHEKKKRHDEKIVQEWKDALTVVGQINGWDLQSMSNRREGEFARKVTQEVFNELKKAYLVLSECLVSVDNHVDAIMEMIGAGTSETRIIGIHGMGGIGKTTIAKLIYNNLSHDFKHCCFLRDVRETSKNRGIQCLQNQLVFDILKTKCIDIKDIDEGTQTIEERLSNKRVLLLLDDAEEGNHIDAFVGRRDWLGRGSKIIITTRNKYILDVPEVDCSYELSGMDVDQSLQLFSRHAFRKDYPLDEYIGQSKRAIGIAGGLPLALEVIGSLLRRTKKEKWDLTLKKLENVPHAAVQSKLKISYDALDVRQQEIFLHIACFSIGDHKDIVVHYWDESKFPEEAMEVLQNMSLIKIKKDKIVWMHDQLRDLGREIVRQKSEMKIEKQSRVWDPKEALDLLRRLEGKTEVEALCLHFDQEQQLDFAYKEFKRIPNLRFLRVDGLKKYFCAEEWSLWHESPTNLLPIVDSQENPNLLPQLRWFSWLEIPLTVKITNFSMKDVVIFDLSSSEITIDWEGWSHIKVMKNLKVMNLTNCLFLERIPDFSANSKLERLILSACKRLVEIDVSICQLKSLVCLDVSFCDKLQRLPNTIGNLELLKELNIHGTRIEELPDSIGKLKSLVELNIHRTGIEELPDSIGKLKSLAELNIRGMGIAKLPDSIGNLKLLIELDISGTRIKELPDSVGQLENLKVVQMSWGALSKIPDAFWTIEKLEVIAVESLHGFDVEIGNSIYRNRSLRVFKLTQCRIYVVPRLPESLAILELSNLYIDTFPDLSNLTNLKKLYLHFVQRDSDGESGGPVEEDLVPLRIGNSSKLKYLHISAPFVITIPTDIRSLLPQLKSLILWCSNLRCLPSLPSSLSKLNLYSKCLTMLPMDMSSLLPQLKSLELKCPNLCCLPSLPSSLLALHLYNHEPCYSMEGLSNLKTLSNLEMDSFAISEIRGLERWDNLQAFSLCKPGHFRVEDCGNLVEIQGDFPPSLESFAISGCGSLQKLPDLSSLKGLKRVEIKGCGKLNVVDLLNLTTLFDLDIANSAISEIRGLDRLENLQELRLRELQQVEILPNLSNLNKLRLLDVRDCGNLVEIQGDFPPSLEFLGIWTCGSLQKLPDLSSLKGQNGVQIEGCGKLNEEAIPSLCSEKGVEFKGDEMNQREEMTNLDLNLKL